MSTQICHPPADWTCAGDADWLAAQDPAMVDIAESFAWSMLASLCGYQIATCPITVRPCAASCFASGTWIEAVVGGASTSGLPVARLGGTIFTPHLTGGNWVNSCGCSSGDCSCTSLSEVILPGPVGDIVSVKLDGIAQPATSYRVDNGNRLVSLDPDRPWPLCQDMGSPPPVTYEPVVLSYPNATATFTREGDWVTVVVHETGTVTQNLNGQSAPWLPRQGFTFTLTYGSSLTVNTNGSLTGAIYNGSPDIVVRYLAVADPTAPDEAGVFEVTYYQGAAPNRITSYAAGVLANEYLLACKKDSKCRLPRNATTVTRGGTTIELQPDLRKAMLAIPEVAAVVQIFNPNGLSSAPRVLSPSVRRPRQTTWIG